MQRSGSSYACQQLDGFQGISCGGEGFNLGAKKLGGILQHQLRKSAERVGARSWAVKVFKRLQKEAPAPSPLGCAVGFKVHGPGDQYNLHPDTALLEDASFRKVILSRHDSYGQWFSLQRACLSHDWGGKHFSHGQAVDDRSSEEKKITEEHISSGHPCGEGVNKHFDTYNASKAALYEEWRGTLRRTGQEALEVSTETLSDKEVMKRMRCFVLGGSWTGR